MNFSELLNFMKGMSIENKRHRMMVEYGKDITTAVRLTNLSVASLQAYNKERKFLAEKEYPEGMRLNNSEAVWFAVLEFLELRRAMDDAKITIEDIRGMKK